MGKSTVSPTPTKNVTSMTNQTVLICGEHQVPKEWKATTFVYDDDGVSIEVPNVYVWVCPIDGEASFTSDTTDELIEALPTLSHLPSGLASVARCQPGTSFVLPSVLARRSQRECDHLDSLNCPTGRRAYFAAFARSIGCRPHSQSKLLLITWLSRETFEHQPRSSCGNHRMIQLAGSVLQGSF